MKNKSKRKPLCITLGAAAACLAVAGGIFAMSCDMTGVKAQAEALYPKMSPYPDQNVYVEENYDNWWEDRNTQLDQPEGYADSLWSFYGDSIRPYLSGSGNSA